MMEVMKMIEEFTTCLANFNSRFEGHNSRTQSYRDITPNACDMWVKRGTHASLSPMSLHDLESMHTHIYIYINLTYECVNMREFKC